MKSKVYSHLVPYGFLMTLVWSPFVAWLRWDWPGCGWLCAFWCACLALGAVCLYARRGDLAQMVCVQAFSALLLLFLALLGRA